MLTHISIRNFTLVDALELDLQGGMTAITGETGAGKSLMIDALGLALGERADYDRIRNGSNRCEVSAHFALDSKPEAQAWLEKQDFEAEEECILRRVITREGRSRAYINGQSATTRQLRDLSEKLLDIHSQHAHQNLLKKESHRQLLDTFGGHSELLSTIKQHYKTWKDTEATFINAREMASENTERAQLLQYQVSELDQLAIEPGEIEQLEEEQLRYDHSESLLSTGQLTLSVCNDDQNGLLQQLRTVISQIEQLPGKPESFVSAHEMLMSAEIQIQEASGEVNRYMDSFEADQERQQWVADRLTAIYDTARKHRIDAKELPELHRQISEELSGLTCSDEQLASLEEAASTAQVQFAEQADKLSKMRQGVATLLQEEIDQQLSTLDMPNSHIKIQCAQLEQPIKYGQDDIEFLVSTNPGQPFKSLGKVASGGELSRISLAIQVVLAQRAHLGTLVFDEVDVGIGGATASTVGLLLKQLGHSGQVLCVTHLPQVASQADHHLHIKKQSYEASAASTLNALDREQRIEEIARMLGGQEITLQTRAHAEEMLTQGNPAIQ